jgi:hypothetical protein
MSAFPRISKSDWKIIFIVVVVLVIIVFLRLYAISTDRSETVFDFLRILGIVPIIIEAVRRIIEALMKF